VTLTFDILTLKVVS